MPTYSYACTECDNRFDAVQAFTDDALTTCPECSGRLRKLFNSVGVVFKGSGFYRTDSRDSAKSSASPATGGSETKAETKTETKTKTETETKTETKTDSSPSSSSGSGGSSSAGSTPAAAASG